MVNPDLLLMDEAFSALDVLTADNLKSDLLDLWQEKKTNTNGILFVTHNIEEAVALADRIIIFSSDPGTIRAILSVNLTHPRDEQGPQFRKLVDEIYIHMLSGTKGHLDQELKFKRIDIAYRLPDVPISELSGLIETIFTEYNGRADLPVLAETLH